ncbi:phage tail spike protein [Hathewaya limosa]|uniref:Phage minor structural protein n=1 Tax=Hathewaya limosa TaxID=1536 RepID=A0ABU0JS31_HATLI|nr:phage tail spike protein [Hathewaya limosa]MDQ0479901.1 phage minor structural protein [Hathewaya limosa]
MICIYDKKTTKGNFETNGLGVLDEVISCFITEELNGDYELELEYSAKGRRAKYLEEWNIIKADGQLFRIYRVEKISKEIKIIKVWAKHIFYDLLYYFIEDSRAVNCSIKTAMEKALPGDVSTIYKVDSNIILANTIYFVQTNPVEAMFGIIKRWKCGEIKRDNFDIKILKKIGKDSGVLIAQGKNILGIKFNSDTKDVVTKLYPVGYNGIKLTEKYINIPNWNSDKYPPFPIVKKIQFKEAEDEVTLRAMAKESIKTIGLSKINIEVDFIELSKTKEYENYKHLQKVNVGDRVIVRYKDFDIDIKVPVIKIRKDVLRGLNAKVELGQPKDNILNKMDTSEIKTTVDELGNKVAETLTSMLYYANPVEFTVGTSKIQPVYLGISAVASTNLSMNLSLYCIANEECTLTIQIQLDGEDITFTPKQKLLKGDNVVGIPIGIPQVKCGAHYLGVFLCVDTGSMKIPKFNLQCMVDGRNLQGGLSSEPPHAEVKEYQSLVNIRGLYFEKLQVVNKFITFKKPIPVIFGEGMTLNNHLFSNKEITTNYNISFK